MTELTNHRRTRPLRPSLPALAVLALLASLFDAPARSKAGGQIEPRVDDHVFEPVGQVEGAGNSDRSPFARSGASFVTFSDGKIRVWDSRTLKPLTETLQHRGATIYRLTADGKTVFTATDDEVRIWDVATSKCRSTTRVTDRKLYALEASPDGSRYVTSDVGSGSLSLWVAGAAQPSANLGHDGLTEARFDPTGTRVVTHVYPKGFHIWAVDTCKEICPLIESNFNGFAPFSTPFNPDGHRLLVPLWYGGFLVVDPATGKTLSKVNLPEFTEVDELRFADNGTKIVVLSVEGGARCPARVYDSKSLKLQREFGTNLVECQAATEGRYALCVRENSTDAERLELWNLETGTKVQTLAVPGPYYRAYLGPDGSTILINSPDGVTEVWRRRE